MNLFGSGKPSGKTPKSVTTAKNINRGAKAARRGGTAIRPPKPTKPPQV